MAVYLRNDTWYIGYRDPQGQWMRQSTHCRTKSEAKAVLDSVKTKILEGRFFDKTQRQKVPFRVVAERVLEYQRAMKKRSVEGFHKHYTNNLINHFGKKHLDAITTDDVERYRLERSKTVAPATVNKSLAVLPG